MTMSYAHVEETEANAYAVRDACPKRMPGPPLELRKYTLAPRPAVPTT